MYDIHQWTCVRIIHRSLPHIAGLIHSTTPIKGIISDIVLNTPPGWLHYINIYIYIYYIYIYIYIYIYYVLTVNHVIKLVAINRIYENVVRVVYKWKTIHLPSQMTYYELFFQCYLFALLIC